MIDVFSPTNTEGAYLGFRVVLGKMKQKIELKWKKNNNLGLKRRGSNWEVKILKNHEISNAAVTVV